MTECESLILNEFDMQYHEIYKEISKETKHFKSNMFLKICKILATFLKGHFCRDHVNAL